jgi:hypothetical protein
VRVLVQWARDAARDWEPVDSRDWAATPSKLDPTGSSPALDAAPGWVCALNVQGVVFSGADHYAVEHLGEETIRVTRWFDDPRDYGPGERYADVWVIETLAPDPHLGGAWNTRQSRTLYAEPHAVTRLERVGLKPKPWADFVPPQGAAVRHGKGMPDHVYAAHKASRKTHGWRTWTEGVPRDELVAGRIPCQRLIGRYNVPRGTKTYYASNTAESAAAHNPDQEMQALSSTGSATEIQASIAKAKEEEAFSFYTNSGEPGTATWPTGDYRYQADVVTCGADITHGVLNIGSASGHFARVDSALASDSATAQADTPASAQSGTGLTLWSVTDPSWGTPGSTDRFEVLYSAGNSHAKDAETIGIQVNESDDYIDGPWSSGQTLVAAQVHSVTHTAPNAGAAPGAVNVAAAVHAVAQAAPDAGVAPGGVNVAAQVHPVTQTAPDAAVSLPTLAPAEVHQVSHTAPDAGAAPGAVNVAAEAHPVTHTAPDAGVSVGAVNVAAAVHQVSHTAPDAAATTGASLVAAQVHQVVNTAPDAAVAPGAVAVEAAAHGVTHTAPDAGVSPGQVLVAAVVHAITVTAPDAGAIITGAATYVAAQVATIAVSAVDALAYLAPTPIPIIATSTIRVALSAVSRVADLLTGSSRVRTELKR